MFKSANKTILIMTLATLLVIGGIVAGFLMHAKSYVKEQLASFDNNILTNVYIENINVGDMTKQDANVLLTNYIENNTDKRNFELVAGDRKKVVKISSFKIDYGVKEAVEKAYNIGREGTLFSRYFLFHKMQDELKKKTIKLEKTINEDNVTAVVKNNVKDLNHNPINASIKTVTKDGKLTGEVVKESRGQSVVIDSSSEKIYSFLTEKWNMDNASVDLDVETAEPDITSDDLKDMTDVLGSYTAKIIGKRAKTNIKLVVKSLNGSLITPGETLSAYDKVGPFTKDKGYIEALSTNGNTEKVFRGGGVGQTSTAMYLAAVTAGLEITERHSYGILTDYAKPGFDAALSDSSTDLKINNNKDSSIYLGCSIDKDNLTITFFGTNDGETDRTVRLESRVTKEIPAKTEKIKDKKLLKGKKVVEREGMDGCEAELWIAVYVGGSFKERKKISSSNYQAIDRVERIGTKVPEKKKDEKKDKEEKKNQNNNQ